MTSLHSLNARPPEAVRRFSHLSRGDIVLFAEPAAFTNQPDPLDALPFLVLETVYVEDDMLVVLTKGRQDKSAVLRPHTIHINNKTSLNTVGLVAPTSFDTNHRIIVPVVHTGFGMHDGSFPVIGKLPAEHQHQLRTIRTPQRVLADQNTCHWAQHLLNPKSCEGEQYPVIVPAPYAPSSIQDTVGNDGDIVPTE